VGRPAKGALRWNTAKAVWEVRVTLKDGTRSKPVAMTGLAACLVAPTNPSAGCVCASCTSAFENGQKVSGRMRDGAAVETVTEETVNEWFDRYYAWRKGRPRGAESVADSKGRFKKWISPRIGTLPMVRVTRDVLEDLVSFLDDQAGDEIIAPKTAQNIWGEVAAAFNVATRGKDKSLRVLEVNPAEHVARPDDGVNKQKPFLRPDEIVKLLGCEAVPIDRRHAYAVAIYTALRQGELRALRVGDVDLDAMQITVVRQLKNGVEKNRTKTERARIVHVEPNLVPLLRVLMNDRKPTDRLLSVGAHNRCASHLRDDLVLADCKREALHVPKSDPMRAHMKFHNLRDTCLTHMAVRRGA
jgi:integrase